MLGVGGGLRAAGVFERPIVVLPEVGIGGDAQVVADAGDHPQNRAVEEAGVRGPVAEMILQGVQQVLVLVVMDIEPDGAADGAPDGFLALCDRRAGGRGGSRSGLGLSGLHPSFQVFGELGFQRDGHAHRTGDAGEHQPWVVHGLARRRISHGLPGHSARKLHAELGQLRETGQMPLCACVGRCARAILRLNVKRSDISEGGQVRHEQNMNTRPLRRQLFSA